MGYFLDSIDIDFDKMLYIEVFNDNSIQKWPIVVLNNELHVDVGNKDIEPHRLGNDVQTEYQAYLVEKELLKEEG